MAVASCKPIAGRKCGSVMFVLDKSGSTIWGLEQNQFPLGSMERVGGWAKPGLIDKGECMLGDLQI